MAAIVEELHLSPATVRKYVYADAFPERATHFRRKRQLGTYLPYLERRVQEGCDNASLSTGIDSPSTQPVSDPLVLQTGANEAVVLEEPLESPRHLSWLLLRDRASLNQQEQQMLAFIRQEPTIEVAYDLAHALGR